MARQKKTQKLSIAEIQKQDKKEFKTKKVTIDKYVVNVDVKFRESKIDNMIKELMKVVMEDVKEGIVFNEDNSMELFTSLIIKHFTDIEYPGEKNTSTLLQAYIMLHDSGILKKVITEFDQVELENLFQKLSEKAKIVETQFKQLQEQEEKETGEEIEGVS